MIHRSVIFKGCFKVNCILFKIFFWLSLHYINLWKFSTTSSISWCIFGERKKVKIPIFYAHHWLLCCTNINDQSCKFFGKVFSRSRYAFYLDTLVWIQSSFFHDVLYWKMSQYSFKIRHLPSFFNDDIGKKCWKVLSFWAHEFFKPDKSLKFL